MAVFTPTAAAQWEAVSCEDCHTEPASQLAASVHHTLRCRECHGGQNLYEVPPEMLPATGPAGQPQPKRAPFDHGQPFRGKPPRADVPLVCGECHADVERMNPYGLRTDQLASYWISAHGKQLRRYGDDRVAVCTDCHGIHDVLSKDNAHSRTYFKNTPETCARCHADAALMAPYGVSAEIPRQYRESIHGRNVLERGDAGSPTCATCHGSHAAAPPGYADVGHVCGRCHQQIETYLAEGIHGRIPGAPRCTGCHGEGGDPRNHRIGEASPPAGSLVAAYTQLRSAALSDADLRREFGRALDEMSGSIRPDQVCHYCHGGAREDPHAAFFEASDLTARQRGPQFTAMLRDAQWKYARVAERVQRVARGVLLLRDEELRLEDARTEVLALYAYLHTLDLDKVQERVDKVQEICREIDAALDAKESGLSQRRRAVAVAWTLIGVFSLLMYREYLLLKHAYVRPTAPAVPLPVPASGALPVLGRRRLLDASLRVMGAAGVIALLWPAIAYVLPSRKRGGSRERTSAGRESDWGLWEAHKVSIAGKPVAVIRTDQGFRALSLVCTHLGCIVAWDAARREFHCPCHAARFDAEGQVLAGPPPRALPQYPVSVAQGEVFVSGAGA